MKYKLIVASCAVFAASASFACPDLTGTFSCPGEGHTPRFSMIVTQAPVGQFTQYSVLVQDADGHNQDSEQIVADGVVREGSGPNGPVKQSFTCEDNTALRMDYAYTDPVVGPVTVVSRFTINTTKALVQDTMAKHAKGFHESQLVCARK